MKQQIDQLYPSIADALVKTPLVENPGLSKLANCQVHLKLENEQITGSFKLRGALSKFHTLSQDTAQIPKVVAASTGNHAAAVCHASRPYNCIPTLFVPENISPAKLQKLRQSSAEIKIAGTHSGESEILAAAYAKQHDLPLVHPYNDLDVIAGQGTLAHELVHQCEKIETVFVPVGGGGLISGIAAYLKAYNPNVQIIGVQPANASEMADSIAEQRIVPPSTLHTISDGTAGGLDPETITFDFCNRLVDQFLLVSEEEIRNALRLQEAQAGLVVEPAAALAVAGLLQFKQHVAGKNCIAIICGGNIHPEQFRTLISP